MVELSLLFAPDRRVLGEIVTDSGAFSSLVLSSVGDVLLGDHIRDWQVHGVPVLHDRLPEAVRSAYCLHEERVRLRHAVFLTVLRVLLDARSMALVTLPSNRIQEWELLSGMRLTDLQRFKKVCVLIE